MSHTIGYFFFPTSGKAQSNTKGFTARDGKARAA